ncbi:MAG: hypothetical protein HZT40_10800 [Candidatus Thiothrix singaporensis]|uniref:Uncharacterized protein n=1 Tax=Candidatus Thiothrix singaporensis TaxID=2799669 RepID=A0A7L6AML1_9GAMM|nr:MAG: hypothetical protein HZT40_10800 [Candidatus Thiothrix singaporensis]
MQLALIVGADAEQVEALGNGGDEIAAGSGCVGFDFGGVHVGLLFLYCSTDSGNGGFDLLTQGIEAGHVDAGDIYLLDQLIQVMTGVVGC